MGGSARRQGLHALFQHRTWSTHQPLPRLTTGSPQVIFRQRNPLHHSTRLTSLQVRRHAHAALGTPGTPNLPNLHVHHTHQKSCTWDSSSCDLLSLVCRRSSSVAAAPLARAMPLPLAGFGFRVSGRKVAQGAVALRVQSGSPGGWCGSGGLRGGEHSFEPNPSKGRCEQ